MSSVRADLDVSDDDLRDTVRAQLAGYKVPKRIERVDAIPKSAVGKPLRRALRDPSVAGLSRRGSTT